MARTGSFTLKNTSVKFAVDQLKAPSRVIFGDRTWEAFLMQQQDRWDDRKSLGHFILQQMTEAAQTVGVKYAEAMRIVLTAGFAPLYDYLNRQFTDMSEWDLIPTASAYPEGDAAVMQQLRDDLYFQMLRTNATWGTWFMRMLEKADLRDEHRYFILVAVKTAVDELEAFRLHALELKEEAQEEMQQLQQAQEAQLKPGQEMPVIEPTTPLWTLDDIGGCAQAKKQVSELAWLIVKPDAATTWGCQAPRGVLFFGPPGNGKTMFAHALASHTKRTLYAMDLAKIFTMWLGMSGQRLAHIFKTAREKKNVVLFFDEADGLVASRSGQHVHEEYIKVVNGFCVEMEAIQPEDNVLVVLASNFKEHLDEAAIRNGRIDLLIRVDRPKNDTERIQVLTVHVNAARKKSGRELFVPDLDLAALAAVNVGSSGADLAGIISVAARQKAVEFAKTNVPPKLISNDDLRAAMVLYQEERKNQEEAHHIGFTEK